MGKRSRSEDATGSPDATRQRTSSPPASDECVPVSYTGIDFSTPASNAVVMQVQTVTTTTTMTVAIVPPGFTKEDANENEGEKADSDEKCEECGGDITEDGGDDSDGGDDDDDDGGDDDDCDDDCDDDDDDDDCDSD